MKAARKHTRSRDERQSHDDLNVASVLEEFQAQESTPAHRRGGFKIDAPFDRALDAILKAKPETKKDGKGRR